MNEPPRDYIEHDPDEPPHIKQGSGIWWIMWPAITGLWVGFFYFDMLDRSSALLGLGTGAVLATWAIEITGNKVPASWRGKPARPD